jgi:hypothetical protein
MINARLIKDLEKKGFFLDLPSYDNNELIISILKSNNERLYTAIPLLVLEDFDYNLIIKKTGKKKEFDKILVISAKIFESEGIKHNIALNKIKIPESEFRYYLDNFKESIKQSNNASDNNTAKLSKIRAKINLSKSLETIFSPGKIAILNKIFHHEKLTNTELKYYYRSIRPFIHAILDEDMKNYLKIIESTKKISK